MEIKKIETLVSIGLVLFMISIVIIAIILTENESEKMKKEIIRVHLNNVKIAADFFADKVANASNILETTAESEIIKRIPDQGLMKNEFKGISANSEPERRITAKQILSVSEFEIVWFSLPNGDIYMLEPYENQLNLTNTNFAFRDWHKGAVTTLKPYVSEVFTSQIIGEKVIGISIPVFSDEGNLIGVWGGLLSPKSITDKITKFDLGNNNRIIIIDHHGNTIVDNHNDTPVVTKTFESLDSYRLSKTNEIGFVEETLDGNKMASFYHLIDLKSSKYTIILTQPYAETFDAITLMQMYAYSFTASILVSMLLVFFFIKKQIVNSSKFRDMLKIDVIKDELLSVIKHEFKTPLFSIIGYTDILTESSSFDKLADAQKNAVLSIRKGSDRLERLTQQILDLYALSTNQIIFKKKKLEPNQIISGAISSYQTNLEAKKIRIVTKLDAKSEIFADSERILQVLGFLLDNAIAFVRSESGEIEVGSKDDENNVVFYIKDNGIGIPLSLQDRIFEKYYQVDRSKRRVHQGAGLSLALSKIIVEMHDGKIWFESKENQGTTFYFSIPKARGQHKNDF